MYNCPFADKDQVTALAQDGAKSKALPLVCTQACRFHPLSRGTPVQSGTKSDVCREFCGGSCFMGDEGFLCPTAPQSPLCEYCYLHPGSIR